MFCSIFSPGGRQQGTHLEGRHVQRAAETFGAGRGGAVAATGRCLVDLEKRGHRRGRKRGTRGCGFVKLIKWDMIVYIYNIICIFDYINIYDYIYIYI